MASHSITIGEGADQITLDGPVLDFDLDITQNFSDAGNVQSVDWVVNVEMDVVAATAALVTSETMTLAEEVTEKFTGRRIAFLLDGVEYEAIEPTVGLIGPFVANFRTYRDEGAGESHWRCSFTIIFKGKGTFGDGYDIRRSISVETLVSGEVKRKVWTATASGSSLSAAVVKVMSYKPTGEVSERIERFIDEKRATGIWVWEATQESEDGQSLESISCEVSIVGGHDYIEDLQANAAPNLHRTRQRAYVITITGTSIGWSPDIEPPPAHYSESDTMMRARARESEFEVQILDKKAGTYILKWQEVWISTEYPDAANHNGHNVITAGQEPPDGGMIP